MHKVKGVKLNSRLNIKVLFLLAIFAALESIIFSSKVQASSTFTKKRLWGKNRYETAASICRDGWFQSSYAVIASGQDFPDALCAAPLAQNLNNAPILLTPKDYLDSNTEEQLKRLNVKYAYIVGGTGVISDKVENRIKELGIQVIRIAGKDRYETSVKIAEKINFNGKIIIASGVDFADALSVAPVAAEQNIPILLTETHNMPNNVKNYIKDKNISLSYVIGGSGAISDNVIKDVPHVKRLWGENRYKTNIAVLNEFYSMMNKSIIYVASGEDFADAVSGASRTAGNAAGLMLVGSSVEQEAQDFVSLKVNKDAKVVTLGGTGAVSDVTLNGIYRNLGYYTLINPEKFELNEVVTIANNGGGDIRNFSAEMKLGKLNESPYQKNETIYVEGNGTNITKDNNGNYIAMINVPYIAKGQTLKYSAIRRFTNGGIHYDVDLADTSGDYTGFSDYKKYTSSENKIESENAIIKRKAQEIVQLETNPYMKVKKIFEFVNTYLNYDYREANKGALNALMTGKGVCEDYADLVTAMARAEGVPTRVVYGYWLDTSIVSEEPQDILNARHAWIEFFLPEYGWIVAEPTVDNKVNGQKVAAVDFFANLNDRGHFVVTYNEDDGFSCSYNGYSYVDLDDTPYIKKLNN